MMDPVVQSIIDQLKPYKPEKIILFGSYAYGKAGENSDVDIAIIKKTNDPFIKRCKQVQMLLRTTTPVDAFVFTPEEFDRTKQSNPFVQEIAREGKVIYG